MAAFRQKRGAVQRPHVVASVASGCGPEHLVCPLLEVPAVYPFSCDPKMFAYAFMRKQGFDTNHHFLHLQDMLQDTAPCANHSFHACPAALDAHIDLLIGGVSCKPHSIARAARFDGASEHRDDHIMARYVDVIKKYQPFKAILENVYGMLLRESKSDPQSPYKKFVALVRANLPEYTVQCYVLKA